MHHPYKYGGFKQNCRSNKQRFHNFMAALNNALIWVLNLCLIYRFLKQLTRSRTVYCITRCEKIIEHTGTPVNIDEKDNWILQNISLNDRRNININPIYTKNFPFIFSNIKVSHDQCIIRTNMVASNRTVGQTSSDFIISSLYMCYLK
jgi:hypothetical protein